MKAADARVRVRWVPTRHYDGVAGSFTAVRERDREIASRFGAWRFVRHAIRGEWTPECLMTCGATVIADDYMLVSFDAGGHYIKEALDDPRPDKLGMTLRRAGAGPRSRRRP